MKQKFYLAEIIHMIDVSEHTKRIFFSVPHLQKFEFVPGQFVMINLPIDSKISYRSYSIASAPGNDNTFELVITLNPPGLGTPYMWGNFKVGKQVEVAGPIGKFKLPEVIDHDLCFIATGTGIAPLRSMLLHILSNHVPHKKIFMVFGTRKSSDLLYREELETLAKQHPEFEYIPVLSRETPETWKGKIGYVHQVYEALFADKREAYFYLCGWSAMLKEARDRLVKMGYAKSHIRFELYD